MNKLERELLEQGKIAIRTEPAPEISERAERAWIVKAKANEDDEPGEEMSLHLLREGMRRLAPSPFGIQRLEELRDLEGDHCSIKAKYIEIADEARKFTKEQTGGFDFFKFIYNRLEQIEGQYVEEPRLVFLFFHEAPEQSDFYINRVAMKLHLPPEQLEAELSSIKRLGTQAPPSRLEASAE